MFTPRSRRAPSAALLVVLVAGAAAATVAALGFHTASTAVPGIPMGADLITVTGTAYGRPVPSGFVGLSLEYTAIAPWVGGDPRTPDPVLVKLMDDLAPASNGQVRPRAAGTTAKLSPSFRPAHRAGALPSPVLRIGGNSADLSWYSSHHLRPPPGIRFTLDNSWLSSARALITATHARVIAGLNLKANDPGLVANEVTAFGTLTRATGTQTAFELGNEPEKFGLQTFYLGARKARRGKAGRVGQGATRQIAITARPRRYSFRAYAADFDRFANLVPGTHPLAGPAVGRQTWWPPIPGFLEDRPRLKLVTLHTYPLHNCVLHPEGPAAPSVAHLLAPGASRGTAAAVAPYVAAAHHHGAQLRVDELNSVSCGGARGVSDTFASALWVLDTLFAMAQVGVDGVNIHAFPGAAYSPFVITHRAGLWRAEVKPLFLGLLAFARAVPAGSTLLRVSNPRDPELRVWSTRAPSGRIDVALINTSPTEAHTVAIEMPSGAGVPRLERLVAPGLGASTGATLGGQSFGPTTTTGRLQGRQRFSRPEEIQPRIYLLHLAAGSAALLTR